MRRDRGGALARGRWILAAILLACCALAAFAPAARADGDPASDVLVYQNLFASSESGMSAGQQAEVASLLASAAHAGFPIRVAIIGAPVDLGAVTALWDKPSAYASFLGVELSLVYKQRLLIVMPNGFGFNYPNHPTTAEYALLSKIPIRPGAAGLIAAGETAVRQLAAARGAKVVAPTNATTPAQRNTHDREVILAAVIAALAVALAARFLLRRRRT